MCPRVTVPSSVCPAARGICPKSSPEERGGKRGWGSKPTRAPLGAGFLSLGRFFFQVKFPNCCRMPPKWCCWAVRSCPGSGILLFPVPVWSFRGDPWWSWHLRLLGIGFKPRPASTPESLAPPKRCFVQKRRKMGNKGNQPLKSSHSRLNPLIPKH